MDPFSSIGFQQDKTKNKGYQPAQNLDDFFGEGISLTQYERQAEPATNNANSGDLINLMSVEQLEKENENPET